MRKVLGVIAAALVVVAACGGGGGGHTIRGQVRTPAFPGTPSPASDGDQAEVKDEDGKTIGIGTLRATSCPEDLGALRAATYCFEFTVADVDDAEFYEFEIGGHDSEKFKRSKLEDDDWRITLVL